MTAGNTPADLEALIEALRSDQAPDCEPAIEMLESAKETIEQLETAVERRTVLGQATGVMMERWNLTPERAWQTLAQLSQDHNVKAYEVARQIVEDSGPGAVEKSDTFPLAD